MLLGSHSLVLYRKSRPCDVPAFVLLLLFITVHTKTLVWMEFLVVQRFWLLWCYKLKKTSCLLFFSSRKSHLCTVLWQQHAVGIMLNSDMFSYRIHELYIICQTFTLYVPWCFFFVKDTSDRKIMFNNKYLFPNNIYFVVVIFGPRWNENTCI